MISVAVRLYASLREYGPSLPVGAPWLVEVKDGTSLEELIKGLGLPISTIKLAFVNGRNQALDTELRAGDEIGLFPPIAGGARAPYDARRSH